MSHSDHQDIYKHGLADNCEACADLAERPFTKLEESLLAELVKRTLANRFGRTDLETDPSPFGDVQHPRSDTEARAMAVVMTTLEHVGALSKACPHLLVHYVANRWHINLAFYA